MVGVVEVTEKNLDGEALAEERQAGPGAWCASCGGPAETSERRPLCAACHRRRREAKGRVWWYVAAARGEVKAWDNHLG